MKTKVVLVYRSLDIGGIEKQLIKILRNYNREKFELSLALFRKEGKFLSLVPDDVNVFSLDNKGFLGPLKSILNIRKLVRRENVEVLLTYGDYPSVIVLLAFLLNSTKPKVVVGEGNILSELMDYQKFPWVRKKAIQALYPLADEFVTVSNRVKDDLVNNFNVPENKITTIYNFPDKKMDCRRKKLSSNKRRKQIILSATRLVKQKRIDLLMEAFAYVRNKRNVKLNIFGEGSEKNKLVHLSKRLKIGKSVEFYDFVLDIDKEIAKADLLVQTSAIEGHPNLIIESMAIGTPVLMTEYSGAKELIKNGVNGFLVPVDVTSRELGARIIDLLDNPKIRNKVSLHAQKLPRKFTEEYQVKKYEKLFSNF